jgi:hypothetical protein
MVALFTYCAECRIHADRAAEGAAETVSISVLSRAETALGTLQRLVTLITVGGALSTQTCLK